MITEDYCSYEVAKLFKEKGFVEKTLTYFDNDLLCHGEWFEWNNSPMGQISAPTHQMAMKWLRDEKYISIVITDDEIPLFYKYIIKRYSLTKLYKVEVFKFDSMPFVKYEDAVESALKYCLENLI